LLDICVKNCGYPFHLQIATKDFLNEFVRRFPERPPPRPSRAQRRILEMIEEWRATIVAAAREPRDFAHIRDMHRLLRMKGNTLLPTLTLTKLKVINSLESLLMHKLFWDNQMYSPHIYMF
jgi:ADP-ribosylation factor-binding protein GGA